MFIILGSGCRESIIIKNLREHNDNLKIICISNYINLQIYHFVNQYIKINNTNDHENIFNLINNINKKYINDEIIVIPGTETFLKNNLVNKLLEIKINVVGPTKELAQIETSKIFCREFLNKNNLKNFQPKFFKILSYNKNILSDYIRILKYNFVVKPSGLYGGKGVKIYNIDNYNECFDYCKEILENNDSILIEEKLIGEEFVLMSFCDGKNIKHMPVSKDYKDLGKNNEIKTGGMGSIVLANHSMNFLNPEDIQECQIVNNKVMLNLSINRDYKGILYGSFMKTNNGIKIIEYNARFGDSECLNVITLLKTKLEDIFRSICNKNLDKLDIEYKNKYCLCKYIVPNGYPFEKIKNKPIKFNLDNKTFNNNVIIGGLSSEDYKTYKTTGSRICCVIGEGDNLENLTKKLNNLVGKIEGDIVYREDIGFFEKNKETVYGQCGVNIEEGDLVVKKIKNNVKSTFNKNVVGDFGDYCGFYNIKDIIVNMEEPLIVTSIDGVGTKTNFVLKYLGIKEGLKSLGYDIVNHCVNDIIVKGSIPLYITDYIANNKIVSDNISYFVEGISEACKYNNIVLLGGETAELSNTYVGSNYEIVGNITGIIDRKNMINGKKDIKEGDYIYGLRSNGLHTNGYSIVNKLYETIDENEINTRKYLMPYFLNYHRSYLKEMKYIESKIKVNGYCHITGGGYNNIERILDNSLGVKLNIPLYEPYVYIKNKMNISEEEIYNIFNCGYGMLIFIDEKNHYNIRDYEEIYYLGKVTKNFKKRIDVINNQK